MKFLKIFTICIALLSFSSISNAGDLSQTDLNQASSQEYSSADFMLNKAYQQLMGVLETGEKDSLKSVQKAWIKFRDANAKFVTRSGGSIAPLLQNQALTEMTNHRTATLTSMHLTAITP
jgi:uncharacterized protein YecT (DUF1311 family)